MTDRTRITEGEMRVILFAVEHGYRQCEKGSNRQAALASVHAMFCVGERAEAR
jgi:hypothetical protein